MIVTAYIIRCSLTPKVYIGLTKRRIQDRWQDHRESYLFSRKGRLYAAMRKYGVENFTISEIASTKTIKDACELERILIEQFDSYRHGYNATTGGESGYHFDMPQSARERMRIVNTGKKQSAETIARRVAKLRGRKMPPKSEEVRKRHSEFMKGRKWTPNQRALMTGRFKGRIFTPEWKAKISSAKKGKKFTPEQLKAHRNRRKGWKLPPRSAEHCAKMWASRRRKQASVLGQASLFRD